MNQDPLVTFEVRMRTLVAVHAELKATKDQTVREFVDGLEAVFRKAGVQGVQGVQAPEARS